MGLGPSWSYYVHSSEPGAFAAPLAHQWWDKARTVREGEAGLTGRVGGRGVCAGSRGEVVGCLQPCAKDCCVAVRQDELIRRQTLASTCL
jgi:hypothetical protein